MRRIQLDDPDWYLNREISWLAFNERVLLEAENKSVPLLERLKFCTIFASNLDEFFMVRLSSLMRLVAKKDSNFAQTQEDSEETLDEVALKVRSLLKRLEKCLYMHILTELNKYSVSLVAPENLSSYEEKKLSLYFENQVFPILTPLAVDPAHPFPYLSNLSIYLAVTFEGEAENGEPFLAFIEIPPKTARLIPLSQKAKKYRYFLIENLIKKHLPQLFPWTRVTGAYVFRVTRNLDYQLLDTEVTDLMKSIEFELKDREQKVVVRLEYEKTMPAWLCHKLAIALELEQSDLYEIEGMLNIRELSAFLKIEKLPAALRDVPFNPRLHPILYDENKNVFDILKERDVLLHHPYDSFTSVLEFLQNVARDPNVLAIKQTLYRSGGDSPIIEALVNAAELGKQVTVVVELKARFDEANNIEWAKRLERAGAHVVFGFIEFKTHAKCTLVVRKERQSLQKYVHLSTGNYNSTTAKSYTDIGFLTTNPEICEDIAHLFNFLTGFNILGEEGNAYFRSLKFEKILVSPFSLRDQLMNLIENECRLHNKKNPGHIILKMNALIDVKLCMALYRASQKGVKIDLIIRGNCALRPGITGLSKTIKVVSIIDRFLEHSRIYYFKNAGDPLVFCASADFMPRNMDRRVEVVWPIETQELKDEIFDILNTILKDNCKSHIMQSDGTYIPNHPRKGSRPFRSQEKFIEKARQFGIKSIAYDEAIKPLSAKSNTHDKKIL